MGDRQRVISTGRMKLFLLCAAGFLSGVLVCLGLFLIGTKGEPEFFSPSSSLLPFSQATPSVNPLPFNQAQQEIAQSRRNAIVTAAQRVKPAVVSIGVVITRTYRPLDPFYDDFFDSFFRDFFFPRRYRQKIPRIGSGFIFDEHGHILTNQHVIAGAEEITVTLSDGREFTGKLVGEDRASDIAVIKIDGENISSTELGDSDELITGEWAIAIGNPFGTLIEESQPTVTVGVISATNRSFRPDTSQEHIYRDMIQTDAAINPGNSGGPLVNAEGRVIGINTFIFTKSGGSLGIGFAIPINRAKRVVEEIIRYGKVRPVWYGFQAQDVSPEFAQALGLRRARGIMVTYVESGSPAQRAGLVKGDAILEVDGRRIADAEDAKLMFYSHLVGDSLIITVFRKGKSLKFNMILEEYK